MTFVRAATAVGVLVGLVACGGPDDNVPAFPHALLVEPHPKPLPDVTLIGGDGRPLKLTAFGGKWLWVYFGYGTCPDVCPAALGAIATEYRRLKARATVQVLFVSVDPRRDRPDVLGREATYFDPGFHAATGEPQALRDLADAVGARFSFGPEGGGRYAVQHSDLVYVIDPKGLATATYLPDGTTHGLSVDFNAVVR